MEGGNERMRARGSGEGGKEIGWREGRKERREVGLEGKRDRRGREEKRVWSHPSGNENEG